jgi:hypothetical protein
MVKKGSPIKIKELFSLCEKDGWFCDNLNVDCEQPYILIGNNNMTQEVKILIPEIIAYFLREHWCGSKKMNDTIEGHAIRNVQNKIKEALGIEI